MLLPITARSVLVLFYSIPLFILWSVNFITNIDIMMSAEGQLKAGTRTLKPKLVSAFVTHLGELSPGMIGLVEDLTAVAGKQLVTRSPLSRPNQEEDHGSVPY